MICNQNNGNRLKPVLFVFLILLFTGIVYSGISNNEEKSDVIMFDTIFELNAPNAGTPVLLFSRYWVSKDFYSIGFKWAEPQVGNLNFPIYPGTTINSNDKEFSISSQLLKSYNKMYSKPIQNRGVFRDSLGSYNFCDIRFAEPEALAERVYKKDIEGAMEPNNIQTIKIADLKESQNITRNVRNLAVKKDNINIDNLKIMDANGALLKDIRYEYTNYKGKTLLKRESVIMPEKRMWVGFNGAGITVTLRGQKKTFTEIPGFHHTGARKCDIEYTPIQTDKGLLSVPSSIVVKRADVNYPLRTAKMSNFTQLKMTQEEAQKQALEFSRLSEKELDVRKLLEKYWRKSPNDINDTDTKRLVQLRANLENRNSEKSNACENLKNINVLLSMDWIQDDPNLQKDFEQYLKILRDNNFKQMILLGGINAIDMTAGWSRYSESDRLMQKWIENIIQSFNSMEILNFSEIQVNQKKYWLIINLLKNYLESNKNLGAELFDIQAMRCQALFELNKLIEDPSNIKQDSIRSQVEWVLSSKSREDLLKLANNSLEEANKTYADLKEPNKMQISVKKKLDKLNEKKR